MHGGDGQRAPAHIYPRKHCRALPFIGERFGFDRMTGEEPHARLLSERRAHLVHERAEQCLALLFRQLRRKFAERNRVGILALGACYNNAQRRRPRKQIGPDDACIRFCDRRIGARELFPRAPERNARHDQRQNRRRRRARP